MKVFEHIMDEEGRHFFYLNEYRTKFLMIQTGQFGSRTLISLRDEQPHGAYDIDFLLEDNESAVYLGIKGTGNVPSHIEDWIQNRNDERYMIYGAFSPTKLLNMLEEQIESYITDMELPDNYYNDFFITLDRYMKNPLNHRIAIQ